MRAVPAIACLMFIGCRSAATPAPAPVAEPRADAVSIVAEANRLAELDLWPGFDPRVIPVAIYDGERTLLFRHPAPPDGFQPVPGRDEVHEHPGRYHDVTANTSAEIGGIATATLMPFSDTIPLRYQAAVLTHEAFHVFQQEHLRALQPNEAELFTYPADDVEALALRRMESEALRRALISDAHEESACWARTAVDLRQQRFDLLPAGAIAYEQGIEWVEGLANYVESRAMERTNAAMLPEAGYAPTAVRERSYATGGAIARLLDRFAPAWRTDASRGDAVSLDARLADALRTTGHDATDCAFSRSGIERFQNRARENVTALLAERTDRHRSFLEQPGWTLIIEAPGSPLLPQGLDPMNVQSLRPGVVLHTRWLRLGNDAGTIEVLGRATLTESAGQHPLFNGVRRMVIAGLADEPRLDQTDGAVRVDTEGVTVELRGATTDRSGQTVTISLSPM